MPAWAGPESPHQPAGPRTRVFAVPRDFGSVNERVPIAFGALYDSLAAGRQVVNDDRPLQVQFGEIDRR